MNWTKKIQLIILLKNKKNVILSKLIFYKLFLICILLFSVKNNVHASSDYFFEKYDSIIKSGKVLEVLKEVDSLLLKEELTNNQLKYIHYYKLKAEIEINEYDEALNFASNFINISDFDTLFQIKIIIQKALLYELIGDSINCFNELNSLEAIYEKSTKLTRDYAIYQYRKASFYRIYGQFDKAIKHAEISYQLSLNKNYEDEIAVSSMLLSFLTNNFEEQLKYSNISLKEWKKIKYLRGLIGMYTNISIIYFDNGKYDLALLYVDSAINNISAYPIARTVPFAYKYKSKILAKQSKFKEAYQSANLFILEGEKFNRYKEREKANILSYKLAKQQQQKLLNEEKLISSKLKKNFLRLSLGIIIVILILIITLYLLHLLRISKKKLEKSNSRLESLNKEKNILLKDFQHRTKNDFSLVLSLLDLQISSKNSTKETIENLITFRNRIQAISNAPHLIMELYSRNNENNSRLDFKKYIDEIVFSLKQLTSKKNNVKTELVNLKELNPDTAIPTGTIINELLTNSIKHAKPRNNEILNIYIRLSQTGNDIKLIYCDNGLKYNDNINLDESIGLTIIDSMIMQLRGGKQRINSSYLINLKVKNAE